MKSVLDDASAMLACPNCGRKFTQRLSQLKLNPVVKCVGCGTNIQIDAKGLAPAMKRVDNAAAKLRRSIDRLGK